MEVVVAGTLVEEVVVVAIMVGVSTERATGGMPSEAVTLGVSAVVTMGVVATTVSTERATGGTPSEADTRVEAVVAIMEAEVAPPHLPGVAQHMAGLALVV